MSMPNLLDIKLEDLLTVQPLDIEALVKGAEIMEELERDLMIEKIIIHAATHYFLAIHLKKMSTDENLIESKIFIKRAWTICRSFLPSECSFYKTIETS